MGSIIAMDTIAPAAGGTVVIPTAEGEQTFQIPLENTYVRGVRTVHDAISGAAQPSANGEDGVHSLAVARGKSRLDSACGTRNTLQPHAGTDMEHRSC